MAGIERSELTAALERGCCNDQIVIADHVSGNSQAGPDADVFGRDNSDGAKEVTDGFLAVVDGSTAYFGEAECGVKRVRGGIGR